MPEIKANAGIITQINVFTILPENQQENQQRVVDIMTKAANMLRDAPGAISASVHRSLDGTRVVNYVQYESQEAWEAVMVKVRERSQFGSMQDIATAEPGLYEVVFTLDK